MKAGYDQYTWCVDMWNRWLSRRPRGHGAPTEREWLAQKEANRRTRDHRAFVGPAGLYDEVGRMQFELLLHLGLSARHFLLDVGCGSLRAGRFLVPYLETGHYFGIEPEVWLVEEGIRRELSQEVANVKRPHFSHIDNFTLSTFNRTFDFVLAQFIFSHASPAQIERCMAEATKVMKPTSVFAATFVPGSEDYRGKKWTSCARYRPERMRQFAEANGLTCEAIDWRHPHSQRWLLFRAASDRV